MQGVMQDMGVFEFTLRLLSELLIIGFIIWAVAAGVHTSRGDQ